MPNVDDEGDARLGPVVPGLVLERIVEGHRLASVDITRVVRHPDPSTQPSGTTFPPAKQEAARAHRRREPSVPMRGRCTRSFLFVGPWCLRMCVPGVSAEKKACWYERGTACRREGMGARV